MFADAVATLTASIFPIFYAYEKDGAPVVSVCGTGFFVDDDGLFVTGDHIMNCAPAGARYYYCGNLPDESIHPPLEIERVASDPGRDLYLGRVGRDDLRGVELSGEAVRPGDSVCLAGYPMAEVSVGADGGVVANVRRYWQPTFVIDETQAVVGHRVYDGYLVGHPCFSGMSGGPVFDVEGKVRGMAAATVTRREPAPEPEGDPMVVKNGIVLGGEQIRAFLDQNRPAAACVDRGPGGARLQPTGTGRPLGP
jgi:S1-C subfamily serine protease